MPQLKVNLPETPNVEWKDAQFRFDGQWKPDVDGALIGPNNYQKLQNLRYKDSGLEGINGYTIINSTPLDDGASSLYILRNGHQLRTDKDQSTYILVHAVDPDDSDQGYVYVNRADIKATGDFDTTSKFTTGGAAFFTDASPGLIGRFSDAPQGNMAYCNGEEAMIFGGDEQRVAAAFSMSTNSMSDVGTSLPVDVTRGVNNTLKTTENKFTIADDAIGKEFAVVMTTRPLQNIKLYVDPDNANDQASTLDIRTWTLTGWNGSNLVATDGTRPGSVTLAQTGVVTLSAHTDGTAAPAHFEELYLYAYLIQLNGTATASADIYYITTDFAFQGIKDVWDGVYRQPIQFQRTDGSSTFDYTLQVNESSSLDAPIGAELGQMDDTTGTPGSYIYIMFEDQMAAIKFTMLGDLINDASVTGFSMKYWNGAAFAAVSSMNDGTGTGTNGSGKIFSSTGLMSWTPPSDEKAKTQFGSFGYIYRMEWSAGTLDGTEPAAVIVDLCTGIPDQKQILPFDWSALFGTRLMLGGYTKGDEGNRLDYSVANAPDAWNGFDSSDEGKQSLYYGGVEPIVAATQLYNRFGASVFSMLLVLKKGEVYITIGDTPEDFTIYPVAQTIGCVAPKTLATAEIGLDLGQGLTRNVAIWLAHSGPVMFDGAVLTEIAGVKSYFDAVDDRFINFDYIHNAMGWVDPNYKEYNLLIPSGADAVDNNVWLVYDLRRKKWYEKNTIGSQQPQSGFNLGSTITGEHHVYGGLNTGHMVHLEDGTTWGDGIVDGGIQQTVKTGDFFPSGNIWDETTIRKFKIFIKRLTGSSRTNTLQIRYYTNTEELADNGVIWQDSEAGSGIAVDWENSPDEAMAWDSGISATINLAIGLQRVTKVNHDLNRIGWAHAFEFTLITTDVNKGFQPIIWGTQYRVERKDNTASDVTTL